MARKKKRETDKIAKTLGASRVIRVGKIGIGLGRLCVCGTANKHLPHCPFDEVGIDLEGLKKMLEEMEKEVKKEDCQGRRKTRMFVAPVIKIKKRKNRR